ncbi:MAG: glycosyltransferase family 4 protein [Deltaproteobacteria bacterium]|nr:MAG: glycosyltransferase family 4 protein [Deltaproteobacteria bacterium]
MSASESPRVGYVVKRYPRYSETFIVNELIAHERAGLTLEIFALRPSNDTHFQDMIARVRAPTNYLLLPAEGLTADTLTADALRAASFWEVLEKASDVLPGLWKALEAARGEEVRDVCQAALLAREARLKGIRHLHAHFASSATTVARLAARFARLPYSFTAHAKDLFHESVRPDDLRRKVSDAAAVVTVSDYNLQHLRKAFGAAAGHVQRIYNGLDLGRFPYESPEDRPPRIVAVGRLIEKKGFADLIDACAILARGGGEFTCQIIGAGPLAAALRRQAEDLGLQGCVELLGPRPQGDVARCVQSAAVFVGLPTVLAEAMALGTPCVSTNVTGIPELVRDGETGLTVPQHDAAALAGAVERLLVNRALRVEIANRARRLIDADFDIDRNTARLRAIFEKVHESGVSDRAAIG